MRNRYQFFICVRNWYQFFDSRERVARVFHRCDEYIPILHTPEINDIRNLSTNVRSQNVLKLTMRKFQIWQILRIGTNYSYCCEVFEMRNIRFNIGQIKADNKHPLCLKEKHYPDSKVLVLKEYLSLLKLSRQLLPLEVKGHLSSTSKYMF